MKPDPIYRERLLYLADHLDIMPPERFDFSHFVGLNWKGRPDLSCGTTACGLGFATTLPLFRELGLVLKSLPLSNGRLFGYPTLADYHDRSDIDVSVEINAATEVIFGIDARETDFLFMPKENLDLCRFDENELLSQSATTKELAAHIRKFVEMNS
jgi:hypothetical protein